MLQVIISAIVFIASLIGSPVQPSQPVSQPASIECMEDMPCWDSATMGNLQAGTANENDAYLTIATWELMPSSPDQALQYIETLDYLPTSFPVGYFAVSSQTTPQTFHIMQWVTLHHA